MSKVCWLKPTGHVLYVKIHNEDVEHQIADYEKRLGRRMEEERAKLLRLRPQSRVKTRVREMEEQIKCMRANVVLLPHFSAALPFVPSVSDARNNGPSCRLCSLQSALIEEGMKNIKAACRLQSKKCTPRLCPTLSIRARRS